MPQHEDLRGRQFSWQGAADDPHVTILVEDPIEVGRIVRVPDLRPVFFAEFAGFRTRIEHSVGVLGPTFELEDADTRRLVARSHYTREGDLRALLEDRVYGFRRAGGFAVWSDGSEDAVSLRTGEGFVLMGSDPRDAGPLLLLGIVMSIEGSLFPVPVARTRSV